MTAPHRRPLIAGNWKMNGTLKEAADLVNALVKDLGSPSHEVIVAPPFTALTVVGELLKKSPIKLSAQDMHWENSGAFTGEVSGAMLKDAGCHAVILGHSERRRMFGDTDGVVQKKLKAALAQKLVPIVCIGETLEERESQRTFKVLETQVKGALTGFAPSDLSTVVLAYEPVWAIGTGKTATPDQAQEAHLFVRKQVAGLYGDALAQGMRILYGGSVTPENVDTLMAQPDVDGALVGGASLKPIGFLRIVNFKSPAAH
ncbi:MAG: triose-phosphate isomerase [Elusimicrobia bacterium]|nr:triose-phosphate isomerase [Elusimicrobiota bacterium]